MSGAYGTYQPGESAPGGFIAFIENSYPGRANTEINVPVPDGPIINLEDLSNRIKEPLFTIKQAMAKGIHANEVVDTTAARELMPEIDPLTRERLTDWLRVGAYYLAFQSAIKVTAAYILYRWECAAYGWNMNTDSSLKFMSAMLPLWTSNNLSLLAHTPDVRGVIGEAAWGIIFSQRPDVGNIQFCSQAIGRAWNQMKRGTHFENWTGSWDLVARSDANFEYYFILAVKVLNAAEFTEGWSWFFGTVNSVSVSFLSLTGVTSYKYDKIKAELIKTVPTYQFPSIESVRANGARVKACVAYVGTRPDKLMSVSARMVNPQLHIYTANTYARGVLSGNAHLAVIIDILRRYNDEDLWSYLLKAFPSEFEAFVAGLQAISTIPYAGYLETVDRVSYTRHKMPMLFAICKKVAIDVYGQTDLGGLQGSPGEICQAQVDRIVEVFRDRMAREIVIGVTPAEELDKLRSLLQRVHDYVTNVATLAA